MAYSHAFRIIQKGIAVRHSQATWTVNYSFDSLVERDIFFMNYLAHIFLARQSEDAMIGALLGDFCKPDKASDYGEEVQREIYIHRKVDAFTDAHPITLEAKSRFRDKTRRYAGIALDIFYDHVLARTWLNYDVTPLDEFVQCFYRALLDRRECLPTRLGIMAPGMASHDWLGSYREFAAVKVALYRTSGRLSKGGNLLQESVDDLEANYEFLSDCFDAFFPELIRFTERERAAYECQ